MNNIAPPPDLVIRVHGTAAAHEADEGIAWWQLKSEMHGKLEKLIGGKATCFPKAFHWSGANSEIERRAAGIRLLEDWLTKCEANGRPYHLVGHSHGGSVIWAALQEAERKGHDLKLLQTWTTVGTPFLYFRPDPFNKYFSWLTLSVSACSLIWAYLYMYDPISSLVKMNSQMGDFTIISLILLVLFVPTLLIGLPLGLYRTLSAVSASLTVWNEDRISRRTFKRYETRWRCYYSKFDEAILGLTGSFSLGGEVIARIPTYSGVALSFIIARLHSRHQNQRDQASTGSEYSHNFNRVLLGLLRPSKNDWVWLFPLGFAAYILNATGRSLFSFALSPRESSDASNMMWAAISLIYFIVSLWMTIVYLRRFMTFLAWPLLPPSTACDDDPFAPATWVKSDVASVSESLLARLRFTSFFRDFFSPLVELYGIYHNFALAPTVDRFIWKKLENRAQGNDLGGRYLYRATSSPVLERRHSSLPDTLDLRLLSQANSHASIAIEKLRVKLGEHVATGGKLNNLQSLIVDGQVVTFKELVHNSYFDDDQFLQLLAETITGDCQNPAYASSGTYIEGHEETRRMQLAAFREFLTIFGISYIGVLIVLLIMFPFAIATLFYAIQGFNQPF